MSKFKFVGYDICEFVYNGNISSFQYNALLTRGKILVICNNIVDEIIRIYDFIQQKLKDGLIYKDGRYFIKNDNDELFVVSKIINSKIYKLEFINLITGHNCVDNYYSLEWNKNNYESIDMWLRKNCSKDYRTLDNIKSAR